MGAPPSVSIASLALNVSCVSTASLVSTASHNILSASPCVLTREPDGMGASPSVWAASLTSKASGVSTASLV